MLHVTLRFASEFSGKRFLAKISGLHHAHRDPPRSLTGNGCSVREKKGQSCHDQLGTLHGMVLSKRELQVIFIEKLGVGSFHALRLWGKEDLLHPILRHASRCHSVAAVSKISFVASLRQTAGVRHLFHQVIFLVGDL